MYNIFSPFNNHFYKPYFIPKRPALNQAKFYNRKTEKNYNNTNSQNNYTNENIYKNSEVEFKVTNCITEKPLLELGSIKLYNDDLLILLLIYFLYKEKINDKLLLIALFSLLF